MGNVRERIDRLLSNSKPKSTSCRWKSASAAASSARWRRASAVLPERTGQGDPEGTRRRRGGADLEELDKKIKAAGMSKEGLAKAQSELKKLKLMSPMSAEATVVRNFIENPGRPALAQRNPHQQGSARSRKGARPTITVWTRSRNASSNILAVQQRVEKVKAPILCLVGPGVGKTSLASPSPRRPIPKFVRMALGGVRDEAEIRGHRRTYIGSMPGKILQNLTKVGVRNPLFLLDEVDKLGQDFAATPRRPCSRFLIRNRTTPSRTTTSRSTSISPDVMFVATANT